MKPAKSPSSQNTDTYSVELAEILSRAAQSVASDYPVSFDQGRAMTYLSLLSIELALKAFLEHAGMPAKEIRNFSSHLYRLVDEISQNCTVMRSVTPSRPKGVRATSILSHPVEVKPRAPADLNGKNATSTVAKMLEAKQVSPLGNKISAYPSEIRYGSKLTHYPPFALLELNRDVLAWVASYIEQSRWTPPKNPAPAKGSKRTS